MRSDILKIKFLSERDTVLVRQRAREIAGLMGYDSQEQTRVATAVSEAVRDCLQHGGLDEVNFHAQDTDQGTLFEIRISTSRFEPARVTSLLSNTETLEDRFTSGLRAARRLMDQFTVEPAVGGGTMIALGQFLPRGIRISSSDAKRIADHIARREPQDPMEEVRQQNQELIIVLEEIRKRQQELIGLNKELGDTNRGVVALHSELEQRSEQLRKANDLKTRFISEMSHEFRTPINSILSLCQILMDRMDGDLTAEQEKQVGFIRKSADDLSNLVNDLLDLARIEAGKIDVHPNQFDIGDLFGAIKGVMRPLISTETVRLVFEDPSGFPTLFTDEAKVSQILRNLISNAIKFTERGEVRVSAAMDEVREAMVFSVTDTGIGISLEQQDVIFQEFVQVRGPIQKKVKGTGLGLPLSRKLAELLGGSITCRSILGDGSTFLATIPVRHEEGAERKKEPASQGKREADKGIVLILEDDYETVLIYQKFLQDTGFRVMDAATVSDARQILSRVTPASIILDILFSGQPDGWEFLAELKDNEATKNIPVLVVTILEDRQRGMLLGAHDFCVKPIDRKDLIRKLNNLPGAKKLLIIDDEDVSRYILRGLLTGTPYVVIEARNGEEGLAKALSEKPDVITLDLIMPGMNGFEVLTILKADHRTKDIPVIIVTSKTLEDEERKELEMSALGILSKHASSTEQTIRQIRKTLQKIIGQ
jgi:signal transduction histidine kinase/CheY-like chemotaxis protein